MTRKEALANRFCTFGDICLCYDEVDKLELFCKAEELIKETEKAFSELKICIKDYGAKEADASKEIKILMLVNDWHSPFEVCCELVKRIEANETALKTMCRSKKSSFKAIGYKPKAKEANDMLQSVSMHGISA